MNNIRRSYRTYDVSCYIQAASFGYHSANTRQQFSPLAQLITTTVRVITHGRFEIRFWRTENLLLAVNLIYVYK
jgi:hypothetical protein